MSHSKPPRPRREGSMIAQKGTRLPRLQNADRRATLTGSPTESTTSAAVANGSVGDKTFITAQPTKAGPKPLRLVPLMGGRLATPGSSRSTLSLGFGVPKGYLSNLTHRVNDESEDAFTAIGQLRFDTAGSQAALQSFMEDRRRAGGVETSQCELFEERWHKAVFMSDRAKAAVLGEDDLQKARQREREDRERDMREREHREQIITLSKQTKKKEPKSYVQGKIYRLRNNPQEWESFTGEVSTWRRMTRTHDVDIVSRNMESVREYSPERRQRHLEAMCERVRQDVNRTKQQHEVRLAEFIANITTGEEKANMRRARCANEWLPLIAFAARAQGLIQIVSGIDEHHHMQRCIASAVFIQRVYRRYVRRKGMSFPRAYVVRTHFLLRWIMKYRVKQRERGANTVRTILRLVDFNTRILIGFRGFHRRVVRAQKIWRDRQLMRALKMNLLRMQFEKSVNRRLEDVYLLVRKLEIETEGNALKRSLSGFDNAMRDVTSLENILPEVRDKLLDEFNTDARNTFEEKSKAYLALLKASPKLAARRKVPWRRVLIPEDQLDYMIKAVSRASYEAMRSPQRNASDASMLGSPSGALGSSVMGRTFSTTMGMSPRPSHAPSPSPH